MQRAARPHRVQIVLNFLDALGDAPPVRFQFGFAGAARADSAGPICDISTPWLLNRGSI